MRDGQVLQASNRLSPNRGTNAKLSGTMNLSGSAQLIVVVVLLAIVCPLLGRYLAAVNGGGPAPGDRLALGTLAELP